MSELRVGIDARLRSGASGGVEQVVIGLADAFSRLDGNERYLFVARPDSAEWVEPHLGGRCELLPTELEYPGQPGVVRGIRARLLVAPGLGGPRWLPRDDGTLGRGGVRLMHFTTQEAFFCDVPSVYTPHDLQHLHLPELFTRRERTRREVVYRAHCERAAMVVAMSSWGRRDLIDSYGLPEDRVRVVPWGSVLSAYPEPGRKQLESVRRELGLPERFLLYPAQTWPHKNHRALIDALGLIRDREGEAIPLVCPGGPNRYSAEVAQHAANRGLGEAVMFPGFVAPGDLRALYSLASALIYPSLFEGFGLPVVEAFSAGLPVASSNATCLPDLVEEAGLLFDPRDPDEIAARTLELWRDDALSDRLAERGRGRAEIFTFARTAELLRAHYRRLGELPLDERDRMLLDSPPDV
jgi:glycosyltransferase involved in cell wall biosynthesis